MIINVRHAFSDGVGEFSIYTDEKISHFANIGKKIRLFDKNGDILIKKVKKSAFKQTFLVIKDKKN